MGDGVLAVVEDLVVGHVEDDEGVGEDALALHGESLDTGARVAGEDEALALLLDRLHLLPHHPRHHLVTHHREVLQVGLDLFPQLLLLRHLLLQQIAHRNRRELVVVCHLQCELTHLEPRRPDYENLLRWVRRKYSAGLRGGL